MVTGQGPDRWIHPATPLNKDSLGPVAPLNTDSFPVDFGQDETASSLPITEGEVTQVSKWRSIEWGGSLCWWNIALEYGGTGNAIRDSVSRPYESMLAFGLLARRSADRPLLAYKTSEAGTAGFL
jgi:hypothetical protein